VYVGCFEDGPGGCLTIPEIAEFLETHFRTHERSLVNYFMTKSLAEAQTNLGVLLGHPVVTGKQVIRRRAGENGRRGRMHVWEEGRAGRVKQKGEDGRRGKIGAVRGGKRKGRRAGKGAREAWVYVWEECIEGRRRALVAAGRVHELRGERAWNLFYTIRFYGQG